MKENYNIQVIEKAGKIIKALEEHPYGISLKDIVEEVDLNKTTVYRIITTLENYNYIIQDQNSGMYKLGYRFLEIANSILLSHDIREIAHPFLEELSTITGEVVHLVVLDGELGLYIDKVDKSLGPFKMTSSIGLHTYLHSSSAGKIILAYMEQDKVINIINKIGLPRVTENTITSKERLLEELSNAHNNGYAVDEEENQNNVRCIAAPIFNYKGEVTAAVSISGLTLKITKDRLPEMIHILKEFGSKISKELGYTTK